MGWDDQPPDQTTAAPAAGAWDATPPPSWSDLPKNIIPDATNILKGSAGTAARIAKGVYDLPSDLAETAKQELTGGNPLETPIAQDVKTVGKGVWNAAKAIPKSLTDLGNKEAWIQHPVGNALTAASVVPVVGAAGKALGFGGAAAEGAEAASAAAKAGELAAESEKALPMAENVPRGTMPEVPQTPKELPVMPPGTKTGDPHALFAYNDNFGPNKAPRSLYNIFGDPEHPAIKEAGGFGSSVPKEILDKHGIPIVGREPRSVGKWEPLDEGAPKGTPEAPPVVPFGGKGPTPEPASRIPPDPNAPPIPEAPKPPPSFGGMANDALAKTQELKNYISKGYEGYAKKPGVAADIADYVQEKSQMMAAQQAGATPLQARQIGHEGVRALGQYMLDNDIVSPTTGLKGMRAKTTALNDAAGKTIGDVRAEADAMRVPAEHPIDVLQQVRQKFDPVFARGSRSGESGAYAKALEDLEDASPTHQGLAELATKLNKAANEANRLNQPHGVYTDIANEVSHINNERIKALVGAEKAAKYEQALRDFGATKKIGEFLKRKEAGEVKRMGPGSLTSNLTQKAMDEFGYRAGAKVANKVATAIKRNPAITKSVPSMFKEFINQVEDVNHEVTGLAHGGVVPHDVKEWVSARGC